MTRMLPAIVTLEQHEERLREDPEAYRPERCCHCGKGGLHRHGHYERNAPRGELCRPRDYAELPSCHRANLLKIGGGSAPDLAANLHKN